MQIQVEREFQLTPRSHLANLLCFVCPDSIFYIHVMDKVPRGITLQLGTDRDLYIYRFVHI